MYIFTVQRLWYTKVAKGSNQRNFVSRVNRLAERGKSEMNVIFTRDWPWLWRWCSLLQESCSNSQPHLRECVTKCQPFDLLSSSCGLKTYLKLIIKLTESIHQKKKKYMYVYINIYTSNNIWILLLQELIVN